MMNSTTPSRSSRSRALPALALGASLMLAPLGMAQMCIRDRFRIEQERWPDMNNPADVAQVDKLDNGYMTIPYFRSREKVTGLAEVDM